MQKITQEVVKSLNIAKEVTQEESGQLRKRQVNIVELQSDFCKILIYKPQVLQKCSLHGMILAKEIIAKARDEINELCMKDLANEIKHKEDMIKRSR